jgi:hypothetical protein
VASYKGHEKSSERRGGKTSHPRDRFLIETGLDGDENRENIRECYRDRRNVRQKGDDVQEMRWKTVNSGT